MGYRIETSEGHNEFGEFISLRLDIDKHDPVFATHVFMTPPTAMSKQYVFAEQLRMIADYISKPDYLARG